MSLILPRTLTAMLLLWAMSVGSLVAEEQNLSPEQAEFFEQKIRPLLIERCLECHSHGKKIKGGLALDSRAGWRKGGDTGPAMIAEKPDDSLLIQAVRYTDADLKMPPTGKLTDAEIALLEQWVKLGVPDPRNEVPVAQSAKGYDPEAAKTHWAYQPLKTAQAPHVRDAWPLGDLDHFVMLAMNQRGYQPSPDADRAVWLRRVSLDLTGLPPTTADVDAFLSDASADPHAAAVDRLLNSRAFGERWARAWLDLVGYADQIGSANNVPAEHAWRYRDYVIQSFQDHKPYDVFLREQLAGDLLTASTLEERKNQLTATGFLVLGNVNIVDSDKLLMQMDLVDQQVEKIGKTFLAMTLNCVRCHDHKFDPISTTDYYGLAGILASTDATYKAERGIWSSVLKLPLPESLAEFTQREAAQRTHEKLVTALAQERTAVEKRLENVRTELTAAADKTALEKEQADLAARLRDIEQRLRHRNYLAPTAPVAFGVRDGVSISDARTQVRGNPHVLGEIVPRGFVSVASHGTIPEIPKDESGRRQLADWLTGPASPLVARTAVNRVWQKLFGRGIVPSVDYFGLRSEPPSHPELLDHLAQAFIDDGWSYSKLIRRIVLSRTYRQTSELSANSQAALAADPDNVWLWRMSPRRLDAEMLRDAVLLTSGTLQPYAGGPSLVPEFPENVGGLDPKDVNPVSFSLRKFREEQSRIRTVYLPVVRSSDQRGPGDVLNFFDFPQPAQMTGSRSTTAVSSQALFLLNGPLFKEAAKHLAAEFRAQGPSGKNSPVISALGLRIWNRPLTAEEEANLQAFLQAAAEADGPDAAWLQLVHAMLVSNEFLFRL